MTRISFVSEEHGASHWIRRVALKIIFADSFDYIMGVIICTNVAIMIVDTDKTAYEDAGGDSSSWTQICGWAFLVIFVLEVSLRLYAERSHFWKDAWNVCDFGVVGIDLFFSVASLIVGHMFPISILRIFRLAKLARISKLLRVFPELRVLMSGLTGSVRAIFWGMILLLFLLLVWSMMAVLFIHPLAKDLEFDGCTRCPKAYDSVARSMLTFWQNVVAGDAWGELAVPLMEAHPATAFFFIPMFMMIALAVMNLILGVVVEVALTAKAEIEREDGAERKLERMETKTHLIDLCQRVKHYDENEVDLSKEDAFQMFQMPGEFRNAVLSLDVTEEDFNIIWTLVDSEKKGKVPYKEFISRLYAIRSSDSEFMLAYIKFYVTVIRDELLTTIHMLENRIVKEVENVDAELIGFEHHLEDRPRAKDRNKEKTAVAEKQHDKAYLGTWQVLEQNLHNIPTRGIQESKTPEARTETSLANKVIISLDMPDSDDTLRQASVSGPSTSVIDPKGIEYAVQEIEALQAELKSALTDMVASLKSQASFVSTMNHKMSRAASRGIEDL